MADVFFLIVCIRPTIEETRRECRSLDVTIKKPLRSWLSLRSLSTCFTPFGDKAMQDIASRTMEVKLALAFDVLFAFR